MSTPREQHQGPTRRRWAVMLGAIAAALAASVVVVFLLTGGDDQTDDLGVPREVAAEDLREFGDKRGNPVFWAGKLEGTKLEFTETSKGHVFVRYLPESAAIGDDKPQYTTVATYPQPDALARVRHTSAGRDNVTQRLPGGGLASWSRSRPSSVYVGFPGIDFLVEVFHPEASTAQNLVRSGRITPAS